jgi:hypothetical protein
LNETFIEELTEKELIRPKYTKNFARPSTFVNIGKDRVTPLSGIKAFDDI